MPAILAILVAALLLRVVGLSAESLWIDEAWSAWHVSGSLGDVFTRLLEHDNHPPLAHLVMWPLGSGTETLLRLPSALAGTLAVVLMWLVGRRLLPERGGAAAAALLAACPFAVTMSRDARHYSLLLLLTLLCLWLFLRLRERPGAGRAAALAVGAALVLHTQYIGALFLVPLFLAGLARRGPERSQVLAAGAGAVLLSLPWLLTAMGHFTKVAGDFWLAAPGPLEVARVLGVIAVLGPVPGAVAPALAVLLALPWLAALVSGALRWRECATARLALWLFAAPAGLLLLGCLARPLFMPRTLVFAIPPLILLALAGVERMRRPAVGAALLLLMLVPGTVLHLAVRWKEDWRGAVRATAERITPGEPVAIDAFMRKAWDYYASRHPGLDGVEVVELPPRDAVLDLASYFSERRGAAPESFWLLLRTSENDGEDVATREAARRDYDATFDRTRNHVETVRFAR